MNLGGTGSDPHQASFFYTDTVAGARTLTSTRSGITAATGTFTVTAGPAAKIAMSGSTANLKTAANRTVTATIQDTSGNTVTTGPDATLSVTFSQSAGTGSVTGLGASTAAAGVATKTVTGAVPGSVSIAASATATGGPIASVSPLTFTVVPNTPPPTPTLLTPFDNQAISNDSTPAFTWSAVTDADGDTVTYEIQVDDTSDFSSLVFTQASIAGTTVSSSTLVNGTYYWRVRSNDGTTTSAWPTEFRLFRVSEGTSNWEIQPTAVSATTGQPFTATLTFTNTSDTTLANRSCVSFNVLGASSVNPVGTILNSSRPSWTVTASGTTVTVARNTSSANNLLQDEAVQFLVQRYRRVYRRLQLGPHRVLRDRHDALYRQHVGGPSPGDIHRRGAVGGSVGGEDGRCFERHRG